MIDLTLGTISVDQLSTSSGIFVGKENRLHHFSAQTTINEAVGTLTGSENKLTHNRWIHIKASEEEE